MGEQVEKRFTWNLKKFSTLKGECCYSHPFPFAGWNWHIIAYPKNKGHLSLYIGLINPESLPSGWRRQVKYRLTVVNKKIWKNDSKVLDGKNWFDASNHSWGFKEFLPRFKLHSRDGGFLVGDKLTIVAQIHVFPLVIEPNHIEKILELLSNKFGNQAADASVNRSQGDSSCQVVQKTENDTSQEVLDDDNASEESSDNDDEKSEEGSDDDDASQEGSDDDDDEASEEGPDDDDESEEGPDDDDDASSLVSDDGGRGKSPLKDGSLTVGNHGMRCTSVASETEVSNVDDDDAPKRDPHDDTFEDDQGEDDASSLVSRDTDTLNTLKSLEDANQTVENGDTRCINVASVTEASNDLLKEIQPVKETLDVNGFQVFSSQADSVSHIFKRHPDIAIGFRPKNQQIRRAYMDALLSLIEMMCQSPEKLTENDLSNADDTLVDLIDAGFKLDWLKTKLNEITEKKKMEQGSVARLQTMEEQLQKLKQMFLDLETQLQKEKAEAFTLRVRLSFNDVVS
ncbi:MATH domain and coiled-coil domain-containing protein [Cardamine amara subsp. amara]|uniref:MATH domain and coiled-coil domain-containing protein n=1 Tax=Cardamine amara subsp. amara TaxID=228776 RepID=A0ABD1C984_CARAN